MSTVNLTGKTAAFTLGKAKLRSTPLGIGGRMVKVKGPFLDAGLPPGTIGVNTIGVKRHLYLSDNPGDRIGRKPQ